MCFTCRGGSRGVGCRTALRNQVGPLKKDPHGRGGEGEGDRGEVRFVVFYEGLRLWEVHLHVFYVSWRLWEAHLYVFYVSGRLLGVPDFAGLNILGGSPS